MKRRVQKNIQNKAVQTKLNLLRSHIHEYGHVRNRHVMFITIEYIKNRNLKNTKLLLVQVRNLFINFELKVST